MNEDAETATLIHVARYHPKGKGSRYLFLRETSPGTYAWYEEAKEKEVPTDLHATSIGEAFRLARKTWKYDGFETIKCGFKYTLPERDEHGTNALFHEMTKSYTSSNGIFFDDKRGHNCFVQAASREALDIWDRLKASNRI